MLSSIALHAGELLAAGLLAGVVSVALVAAGGLWLRRRVRCRLQTLGPVLAGRARGAAAMAGGAGSRWLWSLPVPDRRWREGGRARRKLWRAVGSADRSLAIGQRPAVAGAGPEPAGCEVGDLLSAAAQIHAAASAALAAVARPAARQLADDVGTEVAALATGLASAAGTEGPPRSVETW
jgi:hypothetical protein